MKNKSVQSSNAPENLLLIISPPKNIRRQYIIFIFMLMGYKLINLQLCIVTIMKKDYDINKYI